MSIISQLDTGTVVESKIFNDSLNSVTAGNVRTRRGFLTVAANTTTLIDNVVKLRAPDSAYIQYKLTFFATDGTNSSQGLTGGVMVNQLVSGGLMTVTANLNDYFVALSNGSTTTTPMAIVIFVPNNATNSFSLSVSTGGGTQTRPCRFVYEIIQNSSIPY